MVSFKTRGWYFTSSRGDPPCWAYFVGKTKKNNLNNPSLRDEIDWPLPQKTSRAPPFSTKIWWGFFSKTIHKTRSSCFFFVSKRCATRGVWSRRQQCWTWFERVRSPAVRSSYLMKSFLAKFAKKLQLHPWKLTWYWTLTLFNPCSKGNTNLHSWWIFHCHVSFRGCI